MKDIDRLFLATLDEPNLVVESSPELGVTAISDAFITKFAGRLSGEAVKVYLCLSMLACQPASGARRNSSTSIVDAVCAIVDLARHEVIDALKALDSLGLASTRPRFLRDSAASTDWSWERDDVYRLEITPAVTVETNSHRIAALASPGAQASCDELRISDAQASAAAETEEAEAIELQSLITANFRVAQEVLVTIGNREMRQCELWLRRYGYGPDMVRALLDYCVARGKKDIMYASAVAREWYKAGVKTADDLDGYLAKFEETKGRYSRIRRLMGRHDGLTEAEREMFDRWVGEWQFTEDVIILACKATTKARTPSFDYVNAVLEAWHTAGVKTVEDAQAQTDRMKALKQVETTSRGTRRVASSGAMGGGSGARATGNSSYYGEFAKMEEAMLDSGNGDEEEVE